MFARREGLPGDDAANYLPQPEEIMGVLDIRAYYDPEVDLLMVELPHGDAPPADAAKLAPDVFVELEAEGAPLVLEVLRASEHYPVEWLRGVPAAPDERGGPSEPAGPHSLRATRRSPQTDH